MADTNLSFYLKANRIHIFVDALRKIGSPRRICFMIEESGQTLLLAPYEKRDFKSHAVPAEVYKGTGCMEVSSKKLCQIIAQLHHWNAEHSYRVPGNINTEHQVLIFELTKAEVIEHE